MIDWAAYNSLCDELVGAMGVDEGYNFLELQDKDSGYCSAYKYKLDFEIIGFETKTVYIAYILWCENNKLPILSKNKFTRYLKDDNITIQNTRRDNTIVRIYTNPDFCPSCKRAYNE